MLNGLRSEFVNLASVRQSVARTGHATMREERDHFLWAGLSKVGQSGLAGAEPLIRDN
jgi:hypothetical protein